jgi:hypothetical protein
MKIKLSLLPLMLFAAVSAQAMNSYVIAKTETLAWVIRNEAVMSEVKLRKDQAEKVNAIYTVYDEKSEALWRQGENVTDEEARKILDQLNKLGDQVAVDIFAILDEPQILRMEQIRLQRESFFALRERNLASALQFTGAQAENIEALYQAYKKRTDQAINDSRARNGGNWNYTELRAERQKLRETASVDFFMVLTFEQRKSYTRIIGKPFNPTGSAGSR